MIFPFFLMEGYIHEIKKQNKKEHQELLAMIISNVTTYSY